MKKLFMSLLLGVSLVGCGAPESNAHQHQAEAITEHDRCHMCGMMIKKYPGPKGELMLKSGELTPKFCSTRDMFTFALQPENQRQVSQLFVHDMAKTDWDAPSDNHFIDATQAWYVYGTSRKAVMGSAVAPFSTKQAAEEFAKQYGGAVLRYDQIDLALLSGE
ncbi:nitrous oxide reductase accessory protein NosL [Shewanella waksmanii]|uniref:nitrous oxide reductase accessory protein NosL n=1 Tax=Shewanella waksmanii TaxID=213783 RepID=UPI00373685DC